MKTKVNSLYRNKRIRNGILSLMMCMSLFISTKIYAAPLESFLLFYSNNIQGETEPCG